MPRANEIKKGMVLNYNGKLLIVKNIDIQSPSARGAATLYKMRFSDVRTGLVIQVPEYLTTGEKIRIHIEECRYMGRAD